MHLFHRDLGGAGKPPLVILHGMLGSSRNWLTAGGGLAGSTTSASSGQASSPQGRGYHVFALDLRNHGRSPQAEEMTYDAMAGDVLSWLDAQGLAQVTLLGHSLGGKVAMRLACRAPARVARLVVVDIAPRDYPEKLERAEFAAMNALDLAAVKTRADAERAMEPLVPGWAMRKFLATNLEQDAAGAWRWAINLPALTAAVPELIRTPLAPEDRFAGPARFIIGGKSDFVRTADEAGIRRHFPVVEIVTLAASAHNPHMETRAEFVSAVLETA